MSSTLNPRSKKLYATSGILASLRSSASETSAAYKLLEPRIGAEGIEARAQEDTRIESLFIAFFEPSHRLILIAESCIEHGILRGMVSAAVMRARLLKIVHNTCYTWLQTNRSLQDATEFDENLVSPDSYTPTPEQVALQKDSETLVRKALEMLPPNFREVLILRELEGMSYREIGDITSVRAGTVMSSLSRARGRLRQVLTILMNGETLAGSQRTAAVKA